MNQAISGLDDSMVIDAHFFLNLGIKMLRARQLDLTQTLKLFQRIFRPSAHVSAMPNSSQNLETP